jgi:DNA mismatch repair protein MutL
LTPGKKMLTVRGEAGPVGVRGYIASPETVQSNRYGQFIFINNRHIQSASLSHAFMAGYGELMARGSFPVGALLLTVDPAEVDVNVHPGKTEVRLSHEREIYSAIFHLVQDALRQDGIIPSFKPSTRGGTISPGRSQDPLPGPDQSHVIPGISRQQAGNSHFLSELYNPPRTDDVVKVDTRTGEILEQKPGHPSPEAVPESGESSVPEPTGAEPAASVEDLRLVGRFANLYLLFQGADDLYIVDQHTAHERVLYEQTLAQIDKEQVVAQHLLMPVQVELTPEQFSLFDEATELLNTSGFIVSQFGGRMINIEAVPAVLSRKGPEKMVMKVLDDLASLKKAGLDLKKAMAQSIACRAAVMAGDRLTDREAEGLIQSLLKCENRYSCPHGRPTFVRISRNDLDRQFGRA